MSFKMSILKKWKEISGPRGLQPNQIEKEVLSCMTKGKMAVTLGSKYVPDHYIVSLSTQDFERLKPLLEIFIIDLKSSMNKRIEKKGFSIVPSSIGVELAEDCALKSGEILVETRFTKSRADSASYQKVAAAVSGTEKLPVRPDLNGKDDERPPKAQCKGTVLIEDPETKLDVMLKLNINDGGNTSKVLSIPSGEHSFGRGNTVDYSITQNDLTVSRLHFRIRVQNESATIQDWPSKNGTYVNNTKLAVHDVIALSQGDTIKAGNIAIQVA
ncbi:MAG: FhaA domain-containing protein [Syntrophales bacterium]|jgi:hypothetical protein